MPAAAPGEETAAAPGQETAAAPGEETAVAGTVILPSPAGAWPTSAPPAPPAYVAPPGSWPPTEEPQPASHGSPPPPSRDQAGPAPGDRPRSGRTAWAGFAVAVLLVLAGGGFAAWKFLAHHSAHHPGAAASHSAPANQAGSASPPPSSPTAAATSPPAPPTPSGGSLVAVAPAAAAQSGEQQVVSFLQSYFTAINDHNYGQYAPLVTPAQRPTAAQFQSGFGSTTDSHATLTGISPTGTGVAASVKFTSHQSPSESPTGTGCDSWHITLFLQSHGGGYRIGAAAPGYHAKYRPC
jgi:hypothetical protein